MTIDASVLSVSGARSSRPPRARVLGRVVASLAGAELASIAAAAFDAVCAARAAGGSAAPWFSLFVADIGVLAPLSLVLGALVALGSLFVAPRGLPAPRDVWDDLDRGNAAERAARSAHVASSIVFGLFALVATAHVARRLLGARGPASLSGAGLAVSALALWVAAGALAAVCASAARAEVPPWLPSPKRALVAALAFAGAAFAFGIAAGTTNGDGGALGIFGVLKREELDLRGLSLAALPVGGAILAELYVHRLRLLPSLAAALLPLGMTAFSATRLLERAGASVAIAIERGAPLGASSLALLRRLSDRDHDGASALFGGGDCNDHDARISPAAFDVPGNGVDEDCSGSDEAPQQEPHRAAAAAAAPSPTWARDHFPRGLNVVLITVDTLRSDLGYAGNPRPVSPHLDALAASSVVFDRAYSLASYTGKSVGPMLIGKYPSETHRNFDHFDRFAADETFVQERLRRAGVHTMTAQAHWYFGPDSGIGRGFDETDTSAEPRVPQAEGDRTVNGDKLADAAIRLLSEPATATRPFYLWVHFVDAHAAYVPHPEFDFGTTSRALYDGEVAFVDHHVGRILDALRSSTFADRTAVIVSSDHGEAFGEHGLVRHGFELWEELVRVPLIVNVPGVAPRHVAAPRSAIDLVPTLLDLFGAPTPGGTGTDFVSGRSLLPDLVSESATPEERPVLVDMSEGPHNGERQALVDGRYKLIATNGRPLGLYDLSADPGEKKDLLVDRPNDPMVARFKALRRTIRSVPAQR